MKEASSKVKHMLHLALKYSNEALKMDPDNVKAVGSGSLRSCCSLMLAFTW